MRLTRAFKIASRNSLIVRGSPTVGTRQMSTENSESTFKPIKNVGKSKRR